MKAVVYAGDGRVATRSVPEPTVEHPADAVVAVELAGVCGTDTHLVAAGGPHLAPGTVLGHEFVGRVVELGPAVLGLEAGDLVAGGDFVACGRCWWCRRSDHWECPERRFFGTGTVFGPALPGAQAARVRVPFADVSLRPVPPSVRPEAALLASDVLATGYTAVRRGAVGPGDVVAVVGAGPVGQTVSLAAQAAGAAAVVVTDLLPARREVAERLGGLAVDPAGAPALVRELTGGRGADAAVDAAGGHAPLEAALALVRARGTVVSVGVPADEVHPLAVQRAFRDELTIAFAIGDPIRHRDELLALLAAGVLDPMPLIGEVVPATDAAEAYARFSSGTTMKPLLTGWG